jgi:hypothetical protein
MDSSTQAPTQSLAWGAVVVGYAVATAAFMLRLGLGDLPWQLELPGALGLAAVAAVPSTLALLGLSGRRVLLLCAGAAAVTSFLVLSVLGVLMAILGVVWIASAPPLSSGGVWRHAAITSAVWLLWVMSAAILFLHVDPRCAQTLPGGTVVTTDGRAAGFYAGWVWNQSATTTGSSTSSQGVVAETCSSDTVTWIEAALALTLAACAPAMGSVIAGHDP